MRHKSNAIPRVKITWARTWMTNMVERNPMQPTWRLTFHRCRQRRHYLGRDRRGSSLLNSRPLVRCGVWLENWSTRFVGRLNPLIRTHTWDTAYTHVLLSRQSLPSWWLCW